MEGELPLACVEFAEDVYPRPELALFAGVFKEGASFLQEHGFAAAGGAVEGEPVWGAGGAEGGLGPRFDGVVGLHDGGVNGGEVKIHFGC